MATLFGAQDGERFIERILHGAWSFPGNISSRGEILDLRNGVFSSRVDNLNSLLRAVMSPTFGNEGAGLKQILPELHASPVRLHETTTPEVFEKKI